MRYIPTDRKLVKPGFPLSASLATSEKRQATHREEKTAHDADCLPDWAKERLSSDDAM
jgi:hypothetical protein